MLDPCCGYPLQKGAKLIAYIDMAISIMAICFFTFLIIVVIANGGEMENTVPGTTVGPDDVPAVPMDGDLFDMPKGTLVMLFLVAICYSSAMYYLSQYLLHGVMGRSFERVHRWFLITVILLVIRLFFYLLGLLFSSALGSFGLLGFMYQVYSLWVVGTFKEELELGQDSEDSQLSLSETTRLRSGVGSYRYNFKI